MCAPHGFIDLNIFVRTQILRFWRTQCFREGFTQSFINEAPCLPPPLTWPSSSSHLLYAPVHPLYLQAVWSSSAGGTRVHPGGLNLSSGDSPNNIQVQMLICS